MRDTMGTAATMTGGVPSSYAQQVGQQTHAQVMSGLNDYLDTLESNAYTRYQNDLTQKQNNLSTLLGLDNNDYSKFTAERSAADTKRQENINYLYQLANLDAENEQAAAELAVKAATALGGSSGKNASTANSSLLSRMKSDGIIDLGIQWGDSYASKKEGTISSPDDYYGKILDALESYIEYDGTLEGDEAQRQIAQTNREISQVLNAWSISGEERKRFYKWLEKNHPEIKELMP